GYQNGLLLSARFKNPLAIVVNPSLPSEFFVSDGNQIIRRLNETNVNLFAGTPTVSGHVDGPATTARFRGPREMAMDQLGNIYVSDFYNF
ncbi:hypothetical protein, partial [Rhizobium leguminosarum]|uniref:hypothetical protein n=1 Tax=Rhizobium leguminosarum TaxID=384 RepID=UPI003F96ECF9